MLEAFTTPQRRRVTVIFLAVFCLAAAATLALGLDGNTPGLAAAWLAATALVLAFVHPRRRPRQFVYVLYAAGLGFVLFVVLHNVLDVAAGAVTGFRPLHAVLQTFSVIAFLGAVFVCPPAFAIGLAGALITLLTRRTKSQE